MNIDGREFRNALGRFATGVCVISTISEKGDALGLTANSFSSVSLEPPLVLWNLQNSSDVYDIYSSAQHFAINVLASEHHGHSNRYAKKGDHLLDPDHFTLGEFGAPIASRCCFIPATIIAWGSARRCLWNALYCLACIS